MSDDPARLLRPEDVAELVGLSRRTILEHAKDGRIRAVRFGRKVIRFAPTDVEAFVDSHRAVTR
jgi:excisionase family DNA binding protein